MIRRSSAAFVLCLLAACSPAGAPRLESADDLLGALRQAGAQVDETALTAQPNLGTAGRVWQVDQSLIQISEFDDQATRRAVSDRISADGLALGDQPLVWSEQPHLWATGRMIVAYDGTDGATVLLLSGLLGDPLTVQAGPGDPYPPAVTAAIAALAQTLSIEPALVEVTAFDEVEWPDACLGAPALDEACAAVVTPGWRVNLLAGGEYYELHTDLLGTQVRQP